MDYNLFKKENNTNLTRKSKNSSFMDPSNSIYPSENGNNFPLALSQKEIAILKVKHFFLSRKTKIRNIIKGIDKILTRTDHWCNGEPLTPVAKLIASEREYSYFPILRLDEEMDHSDGTTKDIDLLKSLIEICNFPDLSRIDLCDYDTHLQDRFIEIFYRPAWQEAAPELLSGIAPKGTNFAFPKTKSACDIATTLDIIREINRIKPQYLNYIKDQAYAQYLNEQEGTNEKINALFVYKTYEDPDLIQKYLPSISPKARKAIFKHTDQIPVIKLYREKMQSPEMDNFSNYIENKTHLLSNKPSVIYLSCSQNKRER